MNDKTVELPEGVKVTTTLPYGVQWNKVCVVVVHSDEDGDLSVEVPEGAVCDALRGGGGAGSVRVGGRGKGDSERNGRGQGDAIRDGAGAGSALRRGSGAGDAKRGGSGNGDASHYGTGEGDARRTNFGDGQALRGDRGNGDAIRSDRGNGHAVRSGVGSGRAQRYGEGNGDAVRSGDGDGSAVRSDGGDGDARRLYGGCGSGNVVRNGPGDGDAAIDGDGHGHVCRLGSGAGAASRSGSGRGGEFKAAKTTLDAWIEFTRKVVREDWTERRLDEPSDGAKLATHYVKGALAWLNGADLGNIAKLVVNAPELGDEGYEPLEGEVRSVGETLRLAVSDRMYYAALGEVRRRTGADTAARTIPQSEMTFADLKSALSQRIQDRSAEVIDAAGGDAEQREEMAEELAQESLGGFSIDMVGLGSVFADELMLWHEEVGGEDIETQMRNALLKRLSREGFNQITAMQEAEEDADAGTDMPAAGG